MNAPTVIEGRLEFLGWGRPWNVINDRETTDLAPLFWKVAERLKGKPAAMPVEPDSFGFTADPASEYDCEWEEVGAGIIITKSKRGGFGFMNVGAYCEAILHNLNARQIIASIEEDRISIFANPLAPEVPALRRKRDASSNSIALDYDFVLAHCKPGTADCCIFLTAGPGGFECAKFAQGLTRMLLDRKAQGTMREQRIGDCRCAGWEGDQ